MNKAVLKTRLDEMLWLPPNWDGFGTGAISNKTHDIALKMLDWIDVDYSMMFYVGVDPEESVWCELWLPTPKKMELTITNEGVIDYQQYSGENLVATGAFLPDKRFFADIIRQS